MERTDDGKVAILEQSSHTHPPDREEAAADVLTQKLKDEADAHLEQPPSRLLWAALTNVDAGVLSQLPEQDALLRTIRRTRDENVPANPRKLSQLRQLPELPERYEKTETGERFLL